MEVMVKVMAVSYCWMCTVFGGSQWNMGKLGGSNKLYIFKSLVWKTGPRNFTQKSWFGCIFVEIGSCLVSSSWMEH